MLLQLLAQLDLADTPPVIAAMPTAIAIMPMAVKPIKTPALPIAAVVEMSAPPKMQLLLLVPLARAVTPPVTQGTQVAIATTSTDVKPTQTRV
ncbi:hypothetical protein EBR78_09320 [bacterium]|nr:hypothetical protein [bacterium]NBX83089.1 hypothetical protein [bacterium]